MSNCRMGASLPCVFLLCLLAGPPAFAQTPTGPAQDFEALKELMQRIINENQELKARVRKLEEAVSKQERTAEQAAEPTGREPSKEAEREPEKDLEDLKTRVTQLETEKLAGEDAVRSIVGQALRNLGSKINEAVTLGGTLEVEAGWKNDFSKKKGGDLKLSTAELDFEIQPNDWTAGTLVVQYQNGTDVLFPTTKGFQAAVDRINIDNASITIGNPLKFPPYFTGGQIYLPFGISTGNPVGDVLTITNPLTQEAFEMRQVALLLGAGFPTPALLPPSPPVTAPPVQPILLNPLVSAIMRGLGYNPPPTKLLPRKPLALTTTPRPLFNAAIYTYNGDTFRGDGTEKRGWEPDNHFGATIGLTTKGHCGRPYDQLKTDGRWFEYFCPWAVDASVDYISSVFDSKFLKSEYQGFLGHIGFVPGMAAHIRAALGPISVVGEWNGAVQAAKFVDDAKSHVRMIPNAWQVTLGYQFDWNPWVESIGAQGTYFTVGYSESYDLMGVSFNPDRAGNPAGPVERVGFVPRRRFVVSLGEWVLENLRVAVEYSLNWDYPVSKGGTGQNASGVFSTVTFTF